MLTCIMYIVVVLMVPLLLILIYLIVDSLCGEPEMTPKLYHKPESKLMKFVLEKCPSMRKPFRPALWMRNTHVQTIIGSLLTEPGVSFVREYVSLADGGQVAIDWTECDVTQDAPVIVIIPGLTGDAPGMGTMCKRAIERGFRPVVFNKRGHGGSVISTPKMQSSGDPTDLRAAIEFIKIKYSMSKLVATGISAGSGLLASYVGDYRDSLLEACVGISPGYDLKYLFECCIKQPYNYILTRNIKMILQKHESIMSQVVDVAQAMNSKTISEFEERVYSRLYGYKSMDEYYKSNNPLRNIKNGTIPFLCISSLDDPICRKDCIVYSIFQESDYFSLLTVSRGGHCGFLEGSRLERWADNVTVDYLGAVLDYKSKNEK